MARYEPKSFEKKWQDRWASERAFAAHESGGKEKCYVLDMFPYPSGQGLHVGHPKGYIATDIYARKKRMEGLNVLHPMGWDSFGLPAENYAIKMGGHPREITAANIENYIRQLKMFGFSYDWDREVNTSSPEYYQWTQWLFLLLYKNGLAYKKTAKVNWCETDHTVLANEQVVDGKCERCSNDVIQKDLEQWFFAITKYADRLLEGLDRIDWPEKIKAMQRNWIGRSEGVEIDFRGFIPGGEFDLPVFTTRPDTLFGVTAIVVAPEHPIVDRITIESQKGEVAAYIEATKKRSELERTGTDKAKTGIFTGAYAKHPLTDEDVAIYVADYVLPQYGTGAVMVVPAHDERDFEFAKTYGVRVKWVIAPAIGAPHDESKAYTDPGYMVHSAEFDGLTSTNAKQKIADELESKKKGRRVVNYHLRDWLVSRQRYWGAPIPVLYCDEHGEQPAPEASLPVRLPDDTDFRPTGESPLARSKSFRNAPCPKCGKPARREFDTMDTFVDSSWYFLRYCDPKNASAFADKDKIAYWSPVDMYVGGAEHAVMHLLFARFFTKVLYDQKLIGFDEPFMSLRNQGLIIGENGERMSKSKGNVVNPDDVIAEHGTDVFRIYEMFMSDFEQAAPWSTKGIVGVRRFLDKVWKLASGCMAAYGEGEAVSSPALRSSLHKTIKKVTEDIGVFKFNTAISAMMIFVNGVDEIPAKEDLETFLRILAPFAPHACEELWSQLGHNDLISLAVWPTYDAALTVDAEVEIVLQVLGKIKDKMTVPKDTPDEELKRRALENEKMRAALEGKTVKQIIVVKNRLVNVVAN